MSTTRAMPGKGRFAVTVVAPSGEVSRAVRCGSPDQVIQVVEREGKRAPRWTMFLVTREASGKVEPVARWAVGPKGLVRAPYRANESERMDELMHAARNAYAYGRMEPEKIVQYLQDEYGATEQEAFLAAAAGRLATPGEYEANAKPRKTKYRGWVIDVSQDERGYWTGTYGQPKKKAVGWRAEYKKPHSLGRGMTNVEILERGKSTIDKLESTSGAAYAANPGQLIQWEPRQSSGGYHGDYGVSFGFGDRWGAEYMIDVPHRGKGVRPVFRRKYGGLIELLGKAPNVAAAKQLAEQDARGLAKELAAPFTP